MTDQENIPEAVASATYSITSKTGFNVLFTVRSSSGKELLSQMQGIEKVLSDNGYTPQVKNFFKKEEKPVDYVPDRLCPLCGEKLVRETTKTGKVVIKCSTQKWDFRTKKTTGCEFTEWQDRDLEF